MLTHSCKASRQRGQNLLSVLRCLIITVKFVLTRIIKSDLNYRIRLKENMYLLLLLKLLLLCYYFYCILHYFESIFIVSLHVSKTMTQIWFPLFNVNIKLRKKAHMWPEVSRWKNNCASSILQKEDLIEDTLFLTHEHKHRHTLLSPAAIC